MAPSTTLMNGTLHNSSRCKRKRLITPIDPSSITKQTQREPVTSNKHHYHRHHHHHQEHQHHHNHHHRRRTREVKESSASILTTAISADGSPTKSAAAAVAAAASLYPTPPNHPLAKALRLHIYAASICRSKPDGEFGGYGIYAPQHSIRIAEPLPGSVQTADKAGLRALHAALELVHGVRARAAVIHLRSPALAKAYSKRLRGWATRDWIAESGRPVRNKTLWQDVLRFREVFIDRGVHVIVRSRMKKTGEDLMSFFSDDEIEEEDFEEEYREGDDEEIDKTQRAHMKIAKKLARHGAALHVTCGLCGKTHGRQWSRHGCEPICTRDECNGRVLRDMHVYAKHLNKKHARICRRDGAECFVGFDELERESHEKELHDGKIYECEFCGKWYKTQAVVRRHMKNRCAHATHCIDCGRKLRNSHKRKILRRKARKKDMRTHVANEEDDEEEEQGISFEIDEKRYSPRKYQSSKDDIGNSSRKGSSINRKSGMLRQQNGISRTNQLRKEWDYYSYMDNGSGSDTPSSYSDSESESDCSDCTLSRSRSRSRSTSLNGRNGLTRKNDKWRIVDNNEPGSSSSLSGTSSDSESSPTSYSPNLKPTAFRLNTPRGFWMRQIPENIVPPAPPAPLPPTSGVTFRPQPQWVGRRGRTMRHESALSEGHEPRETSW